MVFLPLPYEHAVIKTLFDRYPLLLLLQSEVDLSSQPLGKLLKTSLSLSFECEWAQVEKSGRERSQDFRHLLCPEGHRSSRKLQVLSKTLSELPLGQNFDREGGYARRESGETTQIVHPGIP